MKVQTLYEEMVLSTQKSYEQQRKELVSLREYAAAHPEECNSPEAHQEVLAHLTEAIKQMDVLQVHIMEALGVHVTVSPSDTNKAGELYELGEA